MDYTYIIVGLFCVGVILTLAILGTAVDDDDFSLERDEVR